MTVRSLSDNSWPIFWIIVKPILVAGISAAVGICFFVQLWCIAVEQAGLHYDAQKLTVQVVL